MSDAGKGTLAAHSSKMAARGDLRVAISDTELAITRLIGDVRRIQSRLAEPIGLIAELARAAAFVDVPADKIDHARAAAGAIAAELRQLADHYVEAVARSGEAILAAAAARAAGCS